MSSCLDAADSTRVSLVSMALSPPRTEAEDLIIALFSYVSVASSKERETETAVNHSRALGMMHCPVRGSIQRFRCCV